MGTKDKRVDAYIAKSADFAQPILHELRGIVHEGCPEAEEEIKWGSPSFIYKGILCGMAAFKQHCSFGFWKGNLIVNGKENSVNAMGQFGAHYLAERPAAQTRAACLRQKSKAAQRQWREGPKSK